MGENMNEEALTADGQKDDDIDYVEDREELTEERIKDMLDAREYKELKEELETNMYPVDLAEILKNLIRNIWCWYPFCLQKKKRQNIFIYERDMREDLINALTDSELEEIMGKCIWMIPLMCWKRMPANVVDRLLMVTEMRKNVSRSISF